MTNKEIFIKKLEPVVRLVETKKITVDDACYSLYGDRTGQETKITRILYLMSLISYYIDFRDDLYIRMANALDELSE